MTHRLTRIVRHPRLQLRVWLHRLLLWGGAVMVALVAILFARTSSEGNRLFAAAIAAYPLLAFVITPLSFAGVVWLTRKAFAGAEGSGIPQTIAALKIPELAHRRSVLSLRVATGKILLTTVALCGGASVGREGPTVQIGAAIMHSLGGWFRLPIQDIDRVLILAGAAAGISAAFNTPLAGIVFAIEELSRSFEQRTSGTVLFAVIGAGITSMAVLGDYSYFGRTDAILPLPEAWQPVLACGVVGGLLGGLFARVLVMFGHGLPSRPGALISAHPVLFAALCGFGMALLGLVSHHTIYGTGYEEAKGLIEGTHGLPATFGLMKLAATVLSYISGLPGGIFAPSLAIGAGLGSNLAPWLPGPPIGAWAILGMVSYFTGVVQAPITAVVIVMEMTDSQTLTLPLMAAALIAFAVSRVVCPQPIYRAMARSFLEEVVRREPRPTPEAP
jgi:H+/Cl- antiporter ClcA